MKFLLQKIRKHGILAYLLLVCFFILAQLNPVFAAGIYTVDVEKVFRSSKTAALGQKHLTEARKSLEKGYEQLRSTYDSQPENIRQKALAEGANALNRQLAIEQQAVDAIVTKMMMDEIHAWREAHKADAVLAKQNVLDAATANDITNAIISAMDKKTPKFAELPVVTIKPVTSPAPATPKKP